MTARSPRSLDLDLALAGVVGLLLAGCGGGDDTDGPDGAECAYTGTANGCLLFEATDCTTDTSYDGVDGGWFEEKDGKLFVQLAPNDDGFRIGFEVLEASGLAAGVEYDIPTEVILHFTDADGTEYQSCAGRLRITNYTPGELLWGNWAFQAKTVTGVCNKSDFYASQGDFINVEPCAAPE